MLRSSRGDFVQVSAIEVTNRKAHEVIRHLDKALIAAGVALLLSGGIAAAALGPTNVASQAMASLPGDVSLAANNNMGIGGKGWLSTAATYIGVTEAALRTELATGKSLADVAVAHGKTRDGLIAALTQAATTEITTLVDTTFPPAPGFGPRGPRGPLGNAPRPSPSPTTSPYGPPLYPSRAAGRAPPPSRSAAAAKAAGFVVIEHPHRFHERLDDRRAD